MEISRISPEQLRPSKTPSFLGHSDAVTFPEGVIPVSKGLSAPLGTHYRAPVSFTDGVVVD